MTPESGIPRSARLGAELAALLRGRNAHVDAETALRGVPADRVNERVPGFPHTLWDLLEHLRLAQADILDFCSDGYTEKVWPGDYWPDVEAADGDWVAARSAFLDDLNTLVALASDPEADLLAEFEHAPGYTLLRELMLAADHNAHHLGQLVMLRRQLGLWPPD